ncbi:glycosyltransferase family 39 protein [Pseudoluteimonas lycopersici]|uniref:Glycosyltransferase family 39 protein n=1 Tax=Pseudoluteimonas lycopersici TaxID=1324796 RepID=A0A516V6U0_9GAMM|nr:glycosyltransferase family 39 protein [Lysobacter lycopersici]QDQ74254.1 glycosyltransferase family 39 protein [Lysobacter lycopersici]
MPKTRASRESWLFWMVALLVIGAGLGLRDPWPADEPRFALVAKQMVESGQWLFPHRGVELYSDKPPMLMWLQAAIFELVRDWRVAFLLPSLLATFGTLWCVIDLGRRLWTRRVGLYAGWALLFALQFTYQAKKAQIDPLVTFWITLANYGLLRHFLSSRHDPEPDWKMWMLGWFAAGLGTITKGVGVLALAMLVPAIYASVQGWRDVRVPLRAAPVLLGPLAFVFAVSLWLAPMLVAALSQHDPAYRSYLDDILFHQTAGRYAKSWDHPHSPLYYLGVMPSMWIPPLLALPWALPAWWRRLKRRDARYLLPLAWWVLVVLFFSIPHGKRDVYIMPALPMACLALAPLLPGIVRKTWPRRIAWLCALALVVACAGAGLAMLLGNPSFEARFTIERGFEPGASAIAWLLLAMASWGIAGMLWFRGRPVSMLLSGLAGLWVLYGLVAYPLLNPASSARGLMADVGQRIGPHAELGLVAWKEQNLLMADRPAKTWGFVLPPHEQLAAAMPWLRADPTRRVLILEAAMGPCVDHDRAQFAGAANRRRWWLIDASALRPGCVPPELKDWRGPDFD